ncbi:MAG: FKBP-type peptidyl-prolyl cis-trans isomerase, partial [archaeon]
MNRLVLGMGLLLLLALAGCTELPSKKLADSSNLLGDTIVGETIAPGNYVTLYYKGTLDDGTIFDQTTEGSPAIFQVGVGALIPGFDQGLIGMKTGEKKTIDIAPEMAYGIFLEDRVLEVPKQQLVDANIPVVPGVSVSSTAGSGKIIAVDADTGMVKIDFNHPLA